MSFSRRTFVSSTLAIPTAFALAPLGASEPKATARSFKALLFPRPDKISYDSACYTIGGIDTFIFSLECPYPRCSPEEWRDRFVKIRQAGFNAISTYIFWNYHERERGKFDFSELEDFLILAREFGFYVIARPGPYVDAEFERGAFPAYVIAQRFPVRSMHPDSLRTSKDWYDTYSQSFAATRSRRAVPSF